MTLLGVNLRVSGFSSQGGRKYMEDSLSIAAQETEDGKELEFAFFAVYDGHGGKEASLFAKKHLMDNIVDLRYFWSDDDNLVLKAIRDGFVATHLAMWKELDTWPKTATGLPSTAGTTASVAFIRKGKLYTGHVGDSRIVLGYNLDDEDTWQAQPLTTDHKPDSVLERKRIYDSGGLVMKKSGIDRVVWKRPKMGHQGPVRRSTDFDKIPFLAVARSLGDLWSYDFLHEEFVVSPEPDVSVMTLNPEKDRCLILASDGLWNIMSPSDAVSILQGAEAENDNLALKLGISDPKDPLLNNPSKVLVNCALEGWNRLKMRADNTSVICIVIDKFDEPRTPLHEAQDFMYAMLNMNYDKPESAGDGQGEMTNENNNIECPESCSFERNTKTEEDFKPSAEVNDGVENCEPHAVDSALQRSSSSPLQSLNISNDYPGFLSRHTPARNETDGAENDPCPIPRWSKSASGQTSLSKIVSWSMLVKHRCANNSPIAKMCSTPLDSYEDFSIIAHTKSRQKQGCDSGRFTITTSSLSSKFQSSESRLLGMPDCSTSVQRMLPVMTLKHYTAVKSSTKRKYSGTDVYCYKCQKCTACLKCECVTPWKRKPIACNLNITAFKAINDFKMSQYHRLKF